MDSPVPSSTANSTVHQTQSHHLEHDPSKGNSSDQETDIYRVPSRKTLDSVSSCKTCGLATLRIVASPHTKAIAGGLIIYGLGTWWVGGSGLIIAGIGAAIWLVSTVGSVYIRYQLIRAAESHNMPTRPMPENLAREVAASAGWATPLGWIVLTVYDVYTTLERCATCLIEACDTDD